MSKPVSQFEKMTRTPVGRLIRSLAAPAILSMLVTNIYNLVDTAFVGRLGTSASGAVGVVFGFMAIIQAFGFMFGNGAGSIIARALGSREPERASVHASSGFFASLIFGALITVFGFVFLDELVMWLGSTETIAPYARSYISYILAAAPFMSSSLTLNNILRNEGKATLGTIGLMAGALLNMACDPLFMFVFGMEIDGAGLSTAVSQLVSWGILAGMFLRGKTETRLSWRLARLTDVPLMLNIMATGLPSLLRQGLNSLTTVLLNGCCRPYGDAAVAAMSIVSRLVFFVFSVALGVGQGFQPVSGYNYGAGKYSRVREGFRVTLTVAEVCVIAGGIALALFPEPLIRLFRDDPAVVEAGTRALILQALANMALPPCMATEMLFQSTGKRLSASLLSLLRSGLLFIPLLLILSSLRQLAGIQEAQPLSVLLTLPIALWMAARFFRQMPKQDQE